VAGPFKILKVRSYPGDISNVTGIEIWGETRIVIQKGLKDIFRLVMRGENGMGRREVYYLKNYFKPTVYVEE